MFFRTLSLSLLVVCLLGCKPPLKKRNLLIIGDSNGAADKGWVYQLQQLRGGGPLVNTSLSGNTIGFTDAGRVERNTLENLTNYLRAGYAEMGGIDEILIGLGTNDCKEQFGDRHAEIAPNLEQMLSRIRSFFSERGQELPRIVLLTPPPIGDDAVVDSSFRGAKQCTADYVTQLRDIASREGYCLVDWQQTPGDAVLRYSADGVHFDAQGYKILARAVVNRCY